MHSPETIPFLLTSSNDLDSKITSASSRRIMAPSLSAFVSLSVTFLVNVLSFATRSVMRRVISGFSTYSATHSNVHISIAIKTRSMDCLVPAVSVLPTPGGP
jgi:hypothetical protein